MKKIASIAMREFAQGANEATHRLEVYEGQDGGVMVVLCPPRASRRKVYGTKLTANEALAFARECWSVAKDAGGQ